MPSLFGGEEEGVLQTRQPHWLEAEPHNRGLPISGSQSQGPITNYVTKKQKYEYLRTIESKRIHPLIKKHYGNQTIFREENRSSNTFMLIKNVRGIV